MKTLIIIIIGCMITSYSHGQRRILEKVKSKTEKRIERRTEEGIEKGLNEVEEDIKESVKGEGKEEGKPAEKETGEPSQGQMGETAGEEGPEHKIKGASGPELIWAKYDFVPGDIVIFEDNLIGEENGEFPSRWDLKSGNVEIANVDGENVIMLRGGHPEIIPYLKDPQNDYLPDVFTIEFDLYYPGDGNFQIFLYDRKNQKRIGSYLQVQYNEIQMGQVRSKYPDENLARSRWMHIAIAHNNGQLKAYMDDTRLINIPRLEFNPTGLSLYTYHAGNDNLYYIKNIRIAQGGVKYYDRYLQDGKIVASGIRFDVNKATLKPESMGVINEIADLMKEHPEINFSVEGHTDSDGDDTFNQQLSEERAAAVATTLGNLGIDPGRLVSKGWGESTPTDTNNTPEGKANNRRVEFVKL